MLLKKTSAGPPSQGDSVSRTVFGLFQHASSAKPFLAPFWILLFTAAALAQSLAPASLTELNGTPGPAFTALPPPATLTMCSYGGAPAPCDYWNQMNGTGAAGTQFPYTTMNPYNHFVVNTFVTGG